MQNRRTFLDVAIMAIEAQQRPLWSAEMIRWAKRKGILVTKGKTPEKTMYAALARSIRNDQLSPFVRTKEGKFALKMGTGG